MLNLALGSFIDNNFKIVSAAEPDADLTIVTDIYLQRSRTTSEFSSQNVS